MDYSHLIQAVFRGEALEAIPAGACVVDPQGVIQQCNRRAAELWGQPARTQHPAEQLFRGFLRTFDASGAVIPHEENPIGYALRTGQACLNRELLIERSDGQHVPVVMSAAPLRDADGIINGAVACFSRSTDPHYDETRLRTSTQRVRLLADSATRLLREQHPDKLVRDLFEELSAHLGLEVYLNYLVADDGAHLHLNACAGLDESLQARLATLKFGELVCGTVAQSRQRVVIEDVQNRESDVTAEIRALGMTAYACQPLLAHGRLIGTLSFGTRARLRFTADELELMRALCDQVAAALDRKRLADELENRAEELTIANAAKDQFLAALSHELRTPLAPVLMTAAALEKDATIPQPVRDDLSLIRRNIELEARLIDDLLDLTRIARGKLELHCEDVDAHALIRETIQTVCGSDDFGNKRITVATDLRAPCHHLWADSARLAQVFWNLIRNAIKFTPDGGRVEVRTENPSGDEDRLHVVVTDSGIGIDAELLPRIFDAFEQGAGHRLRNFGGLGLGLAITKALVDMHGGSIRGDSAGHGRGATFTLELTCLRPAPKRPRQPQRPQAQRAGLRILLVEDHEMTARVLERLLRGMNYQVATAGSVKHALDAARSGTFDLLISDLGLPDGSGLDLMRELRQSHRIKGIALSGYGMEDDIRRSREVGFAAHLTKPVTIEKLAATINQVA